MGRSWVWLVALGARGTWHSRCPAAFVCVCGWGWARGLRVKFEDSLARSGCSHVCGVLETHAPPPFSPARQPHHLRCPAAACPVLAPQTPACLRTPLKPSHWCSVAPLGAPDAGGPPSRCVRPGRQHLLRPTRQRLLPGPAWAWSSAASRCGARAARSFRHPAQQGAHGVWAYNRGSTPSSSTPRRWTRPAAAPWWSAAPATPSRCSISRAPACSSIGPEPDADGPTPQQRPASASPRAGGPHTPGSSSPPAPAGFQILLNNHR